MRQSLFRYSGNKGRLISHLPEPPPGTKRIIEPFLGSGAYTLSKGFPGLGLDADLEVITLWEFLQKTSPAALRDLDSWWEVRKLQAPPPSISEIADLFGTGASLYFKINVCGAYVGQWSSQTTYPQHSLPVEKTIQALKASQNIQVLQADWREVRRFLREGDVVFFDPPYLGTKGNYKNEGSFDPKGIPEEITSWGVPVLFTYGSGAPEIFPELEWELLLKRKVPRLRGGGTVDREEWISRIRWDLSDDALSMFGEI